MGGGGIGSGGGGGGAYSLGWGQTKLRNTPSPNHETLKTECLYKTDGPETWTNLVGKLNFYKFVAKEKDS